MEDRNIKTLLKIKLFKEIRVICDSIQGIRDHWENPYPNWNISITKNRIVDQNHPRPEFGILKPSEGT